VKTPRKGFQDAVLYMLPVAPVDPQSDRLLARLLVQLGRNLEHLLRSVIRSEGGRDSRQVMYLASLWRAVHDLQFARRISRQSLLAVTPDARYFLVIIRAEAIQATMRSFSQIFLALGDTSQRVGMRMDRATDQQIAADFPADRIGQCLVDAQLMKPRSALQMEVVEQIENDVARRGHEIHVPGCAVAVHRHGASAVGQEGGGQADILHVFEGRSGWLTRYHRLNTIVERTKEHLIAFVEIAFVSILARRLKRLTHQEVSA
jgi:hypothetical protein